MLLCRESSLSWWLERDTEGITGLPSGLMGTHSDPVGEGGPGPLKPSPVPPRWDVAFFSLALRWPREDLRMMAVSSSLLASMAMGMRKDTSTPFSKCIHPSSMRHASSSESPFLTASMSLVQISSSSKMCRSSDAGSSSASPNNAAAAASALTVSMLLFLSSSSPSARSPRSWARLLICGCRRLLRARTLSIFRTLIPWLRSLAWKSDCALFMKLFSRPTATGAAEPSAASSPVMEAALERGPLPPLPTLKRVMGALTRLKCSVAPLFGGTSPDGPGLTGPGPSSVLWGIALRNPNRMPQKRRNLRKP
mmetsp:Transcript_60654/g.192521  ORF Transcript_60654/g.192521 Transcript_60654/m.192521 type:complete len:308 (+) Transcript_60654:1026-1949(+)